MRLLTELFIKALDLLEAEGRLLRRNVLAVATALIAFAIIGLVAVIGVMLLILSLYMRIKADYGPITAALIAGIINVTLAAASIWGARQWIEKNH